MSATKILWEQILVVTLIVLATTWGATQYVAWQLGFQAQLGTPWFKLGGVSVYYPPAFFWWWYFYDAYAPDIFTEGAFIAASGGFIAIAVAIGIGGPLWAWWAIVISSRPRMMVAFSTGWPVEAFVSLTLNSLCALTATG